MLQYMGNSGKRFTAFLTDLIKRHSLQWSEETLKATHGSPTVQQMTFIQMAQGQNAK